MSTVETTSLITAIESAVSQALLGKPDAVRLAVVALLTGGHVLIEDVPGVGKTVLAKALARCLDGQFTRLQCTPDLLPSDILGSNVYLPNLGEFEFRRGPIFTNVLLADEINRTTPRTQSALLEAMNESQVTIEGTTYQLPHPFFLLATQNPYEYEGTFPLPENQRDRFMLCIEIGYPERSVERDVLVHHRNGDPIDRLEPVLDTAQLCELQANARAVVVDEAINDYVLNLVEATREHDELELGVSPRGAITLYRAAQGLALVDGREYVVPDDIKTLAVAVLAHRVVCRGPLRETRRDRAVGIIQQVLDKTPIPD